MLPVQSTTLLAIFGCLQLSGVYGTILANQTISEPALSANEVDSTNLRFENSIALALKRVLNIPVSANAPKIPINLNSSATRYITELQRSNPANKYFWSGEHRSRKARFAPMIQSDVVYSLPEERDNRHGEVFQFEIGTVKKNPANDLTVSEFRFYREQGKSKHNEAKTGKITFAIYDLDEINVHRSSISAYYAIDTISLPGWRSGWVTFNVANALRKRLKRDSSHTKFKLLLTVTPERTMIERLMPTAIGVIHNGNKNAEYQPFLTAYFCNDKSKHATEHLIQKKDPDSDAYELFKQKNSGQYYYPWRTESQVNWNKLLILRTSAICCKVIDFTVDALFVESLKEFIIGPDIIPLNYCAGSCRYPIPDDCANTHHATILAMFSYLVEKVGKEKIPGSSCVPIEFKPFYLNYIEMDGATVHKMMNDLIVTKCGCQ